MKNQDFFNQLKKKLKMANDPWILDKEQLANADKYALGYTPDPKEKKTLEDREESAKKKFLKAKKKNLKSSNVPEKFDWRDVSGRNFISSVKNQNPCGSCVAFGTAATFEGAIRTDLDIAVNDAGGTSFEDLSEAQLFYCGGGAAGRNCSNGWWPNAALEYCKQTGLVPDSCFPYTPVDQPCKLCSDWKDRVSKLAKYHTITGAEDMKKWLSTRGPLVGCFTVYSDFFGYKGGVYKHVSGVYKGGHCICVVGYNDELQAWLCKNSWGSGWGVGGYFWIAYGQCGIDDDMQAVDDLGVLYPFYNDVYMRNNLNEVGAVNPPAESWTKSPDIIPNGPELIQDPVNTLRETYRQDIGKPVSLNEQNYYYLRSKNFKNAANEAKFEMYYCPQSLFLYPEAWMGRSLETSSGKKQVTAKAKKRGEIMVPENAFTNVPTSDEHHCLITRVITKDHPNPLPKAGEITTMDELAAYIQTHPGMAWRNVVTVPKEKPTFVNTFDFDSGAAGGRILVGMNCVNTKKGSKVAFSCGDPIPSGPSKGKYIELKKMELTQDNEFVGEMLLDVPADFKTKISMSYWAKQPVEEEWEITFEAILVVDQKSKSFKYSKPLEELGYSSNLLKSNDIKKGILLGSITVKGK